MLHFVRQLFNSEDGIAVAGNYSSVTTFFSVLSYDKFYTNRSILSVASC